MFKLLFIFKNNYNNIIMERVGVCGFKGSGKDTLADYLVKNNGFIKYNFADPVKDISKILFNLSDEQLNGNEKEIIDHRWGLSPRTIFQRLGTEFGQYKIYDLFPELKKKIENRKLWLTIFEHFLNNNKDKKIVVADVRFKHEIEFLKKHHFNIIKINRDGTKKDLHISENEIKQCDRYIDFTINNNSSKKELFNTLDEIIIVPF